MIECSVDIFIVSLFFNHYKGYDTLNTKPSTLKSKQFRRIAKQSFKTTKPFGLDRERGRLT